MDTYTGIDDPKRDLQLNRDYFMKNAIPEKVEGGRSALCGSEIAERRSN